MVIGAASYGVLGHVRALLDFQLFNFLVTSQPHKLKFDSMWLPIQKKNIQAYSFVTVYCMNFIIFLHVTLKLLVFSLSLVPLLAPNRGDATANGGPGTCIILHPYADDIVTPLITQVYNAAYIQLHRRQTKSSTYSKTSPINAGSLISVTFIIKTRSI